MDISTVTLEVLMGGGGGGGGGKEKWDALGVRTHASGSTLVLPILD